MIYVVDVETKPNEKLIGVYSNGLKAPSNYKDKDKIEAYINELKVCAVREMSLDQDMCEVRCIGLKKSGEAACILTLHQFADVLADDEFWQLVTFNGKQFDIPVIIKCGVRSGVKLPYRQLMDCTKKFRSESHIDLIEVLSCGGKCKSLDVYSQVYLGRCKEPIDFATASDAEVEEHCLADVEMTWELFEKFMDVIM